jgi:hypothetical protein
MAAPAAPEQMVAEAKAEAGNAGGEAALPTPPPRKIVYNATADLVVESLATAEERLDEIIKAHKAILGRSDIQTAPGAPRSGRWTVRVPVDEFPAFMKDIAKLGELQRNKTDSDDVTEEFYDLDERIKNMKKQQETLRRFLDQAVTMQDKVTIDDKLRQVTTDLERLESRLKRLDNLSALSTVTLNISERKDYVPTGAPSFGASIARTFHGSLDLLGDFGRAVVLITVAVAPWLLVAVLIALPPGLLIRRRRRARAVNGNQPSAPATLDAGTQA